MTEQLRRGVKELIAAAMAEIEQISAADAIRAAESPACLIVDVRDARERARDGYIPGSFHCPRGMLEFWIDPESPYFKPAFAGREKLIFHCAGDWRAVLSVQTVGNMGVANAVQMQGGLSAWRQAGGAVATDTPRTGADTAANAQNR